MNYYHRPTQRELLKTYRPPGYRLNGYCGKYTGNGVHLCENCGHFKDEHKTIQVADCVYYGVDSFGTKRQSWRVTGHYKKRIHPHFNSCKPDDSAERAIWEFVEETLLETKLKAMEQQPERIFTHCFVWTPCLPEEADAVGLVSVCGAIAPLECCEFNRVVEWTEEHIKRDQERALHRVLHPEFHTHTDYMWD